MTTTGLNGSSLYRAAEYANRKVLVQSAIKMLVLKNLVTPQKGDIGFLYFITNRGNEIANKFQSDYSVRYINSCRKTKELLSDNKTDIALERLINSNAKADSSL